MTYKKSTWIQQDNPYFSIFNSVRPDSFIYIIIFLLIIIILQVLMQLYLVGQKLLYMEYIK